MNLIFISVSKYWSQNYGYKSLDFSIDTFALMGLIEFGYFYQYQIQTGYSLWVFLCGLAASFAQISGIGPSMNFIAKQASNVAKLLTIQKNLI